MSINYDGLRALASSMIKSAGFKTVLRREIKTAGTPWGKDAVTTEDYPVSVVIGAYDDTMIDGERIKQGDLKVFLEVSSLKGLIPNVNTDTVLYREQYYRIIGIKTPSPGGIDLLYEMQVRGV